MSELVTQWRKGRGVTQLDFYLPPCVVGGPVVRAEKMGSSEAMWFIRKVSTMLKAQPGDQVDMTADVVTDAGIVLYNRAVRILGPGVYSLWDMQWVDVIAEKGITATLSCSRLGEGGAVFEGLVRVWFERDLR